MGLYHPLGDFATNFSSIYQDMVANGGESLHWQKVGDNPHWCSKQSSKGSKKSAKKSAAARTIHKTEQILIVQESLRERALDKVDKDATLVLRLYFDGKQFVADTNIGLFTVQERPRADGGGWDARWGTLRAYAPSPKGALIQLLRSTEWGRERVSGKPVSLAEMYFSVFFEVVGEGATIKAPTGVITRTITTSADFIMAWGKDNSATPTPSTPTKEPVRTIPVMSGKEWASKLRAEAQERNTKATRARQSARDKARHRAGMA